MGGRRVDVAVIACFVHHSLVVGPRRNYVADVVVQIGATYHS